MDTFIETYKGWKIYRRFVQDLYEYRWSAIKVDRSAGMSGYLSYDDVVFAIDKRIGKR